MRKGRAYISVLFLWLSLVIVAAPMVQHHHHHDRSDGNELCMKNDLLAGLDGCTDVCHDHSHNHAETGDPCGADNCLAKALTQAVLLQGNAASLSGFVVTITPLPVFLISLVSTSFPSLITESHRVFYIESLHAVSCVRAGGLRAPPFVG
ncbi:MAG: hypothetical protein LBM61_05425 [Prevotellaceae bacterium]|jgi:hypothetical protein|nr:hypothetical protein [Prevotellaceae bacterium]